MLLENIKLLGQYAQDAFNTLNNYEQNRQEAYSDVFESKSGQKTLQVLVNGSMQLLHSKYDPKNEAERFIAQFRDNIDQYDHVLFYGVGLGYHIKVFMTQFPNFTFSLYEPEVEIFYQFMNYFHLEELPLARLKDVLIETSREKGKLFITSKMNHIQERVLIVTLPSYERVFKEKFQLFLEDFKSVLDLKRKSHIVNRNFSARWTLNSLLNLPTTTTTPNIFDGFDYCFKDKPLVIVSAGPSLEEEYDNLRFIKNHKLAYIFAVGSANRALISQNIIPDAVCTYDPQEHNYNVFSTMYEKGVETVPMIYGTSVGFETLKMYQGPKVHVIIDQDTVTPFYFNNQIDFSSRVVQDSPTIAAVTFQIAAKLGCNPIIFSGQNLGFKNNQFYSKDVNYNGSEQLLDRDRRSLIIIEDVLGNKMESNPSFINMKENIEWYISKYPNIKVWNTTKGGAAIKGAIFKSMEDLITDNLTEPVVLEKWYKSNNNYGEININESIIKMNRSILEIKMHFKELINILDTIQKNIRMKKEQKISNNILKFDKAMKKLLLMDSYNVFIQPVNREHFQALSIKSANIRKQINEIEKGKLIIESFLPYLERCNKTIEQIEGSIYKIHRLINKGRLIENPNKFYSSDCGCFQYIGDWSQLNLGPGKSIDYRILMRTSKKKGSIIRFKFTGSLLRLFGSNYKDSLGEIQITIDGKSEVIPQKSIMKKISKHSYPSEVLLEKVNLDKREHIVEIKLQGDKLFEFSGAEIEENGRILHVDEVLNLEDLKIGKRIRCSYEAKFNKFGIFSGLGLETNKFIPIESTAYPNGDFYLIMVDKIKGERILISDRNIQNFVTYDSLKEAGITGTDGKVIGDFYKTMQATIRLLTGGISIYDKLNEWHIYIEHTSHENIDFDMFMWNYNFCGSWTNSTWEENENAKVIRGGVELSFWTAALTYSSDKDKGFRPLIKI
ncbi:motility associated factor glycosyltransferase family protein [Bacillus sp. CGMCC 1.16607]|uniref:motility associated factor glycosyltransferase family protein n=1 Tax=Bacillus sp. CGMCC 1.16607 TaxID=3351842 RepID=UPI003626475C